MGTAPGHASTSSARPNIHVAKVILIDAFEPSTTGKTATIEQRHEKVILQHDNARLPEVLPGWKSTHFSSFVEALGFFISGFLAAVSCGLTVDSLFRFCKSSVVLTTGCGTF